MKHRQWMVFVGVVIVVTGLCISTTTMAVSLFASSPSSMFADTKARGIGDLVTVVIVEQARATQSANTSSGKESNFNVGPGLGVLADLIPLLRLSGGDDFSAGGTTSRGGSLSATMTTRVVEIFPNGNMRIEGRQRIVINAEEQEMVVSGVVRSRDIAPDNTIISSLVADAQIEFSGTGVVGDKHQPGILTRLFNWLF